MANIIDATAAISITIAAQGFGNLTVLTTSPNPAAQNATITINCSIKNDGATDTLWAKYYVGGTLLGSTWSASVTGGATQALPSRTFTMPGSAVVVQVTAGHMAGATETQDDAMQLTQNILQYAEAVFSGTPIYSPGQTVESGTVVTITYQVQNTGYVGSVWGGLYDLATPNPNLIGGYFEESFTAGQIKTKTVAITVNSDVSAQLICGHIE